MKVCVCVHKHTNVSVQGDTGGASVRLMEATCHFQPIWEGWKTAKGVLICELEKKREGRGDEERKDRAMDRGPVGLMLDENEQGVYKL